MPEYPYTIENGAGEWLTFERRSRSERSDRVDGGARVAPGAGPPMHVHFLQDEGFTVLDGRLGFQRLGEEPRYAEAGQSVVFRAGEAHRFWNAGDTELRCSAYVEPAGNVEFLLAALFASQKGNGGRRPTIWDTAYLTRRYRTEYAILVVPGPVQRVVFPVVVAVGHLLGKYRKYAAAPRPLDR